MKITIEPVNQSETEVIIRGDIAGNEVQNLLLLLNSKNQSNKLFLYKDDEQFLIDVSDIIFIEAGNNKVLVTATEGSFEAKQKLYELKGMLADKPFAQINKSTLVNIDFVKSVQAEFSGNYTLKLKERKEVLTVSRKYFKEFRSRI